MRTFDVAIYYELAHNSRRKIRQITNISLFSALSPVFAMKRDPPVAMPARRTAAPARARAAERPRHRVAGSAAGHWTSPAALTRG